MSASHIIEADLTWTGRGFESEIQVEIGLDGRIGRVGALGLTVLAPDGAVGLLILSVLLPNIVGDLRARRARARGRASPRSPR